MFEEADCDHSPLRVILNRDHGCFGMKRAVGAFDQDAIAKFQRTVDHKPVSYTHLDVYKRQGQECPRHTTLTPTQSSQEASM